MYGNCARRTRLGKPLIRTQYSYSSCGSAPRDSCLLRGTSFATALQSWRVSKPPVSYGRIYDEGKTNLDLGDDLVAGARRLQQGATPGHCRKRRYESTERRSRKRSQSGSEGD